MPGSKYRNASNAKIITRFKPTKGKFLTFSTFQNVDHKCKFRSKKGMLPFIEMNGEEIADSNIIIETLSKKFDKVH